MSPKRVTALFSSSTELSATGGPPSFPFATALRRTLAAGYGLASFQKDVMSGVVVGIVALPLSMALAIAVGVPPQHGLYTAIIAGTVVALTGGSKYQITGPTAAFVVILAPIHDKFGLSGLLTAGLLAGLVLLGLGFARMGRLIEFIPHPVTTGFTAGIATVIATLQLKDVFGLRTGKLPDGFLEKVAELWAARGTARLADFAVAASTLALLLLVPKVVKRIPAPLIAVGLVSAAVAALHAVVPSFGVDTIGTRFHAEVSGRVVHGIPPVPPRFVIPWPEGGLSIAYVRALLPSAFAIAMLGAIESLLSAVIADGMTGKRHDPNAELVGLGIGNLLCPFFGGIAATGALARTATNIRAGAQSPFSSVVHAALVLLSILLLAPLVAYIPMASLAGLLLLVAWNMSEVRHFIHTAKVAPKSDVTVLVACYVLTVAFDMVVAVTFGVILAALLFMRRMAELTEARSVLDRGASEIAFDVPAGVELYEIAGPLFFGAAQKAMGVFDHVGDDVKVIVLDLGRVPAIDSTGLVALESSIARLSRAKKHVIIAGPLPEPRRVFEKAALDRTCRLVPSRAAALEIAAHIASEIAPPSTRDVHRPSLAARAVQAIRGTSTPPPPPSSTS